MEWGVVGLSVSGGMYLIVCRGQFYFYNDGQGLKISALIRRGQCF